MARYVRPIAPVTKERDLKEPKLSLAQIGGEATG